VRRVEKDRMREEERGREIERGRENVKRKHEDTFGPPSKRRKIESLRLRSRSRSRIRSRSRSVSKQRSRSRSRLRSRSKSRSRSPVPRGKDYRSHEPAREVTQFEFATAQKDGVTKRKILVDGHTKLKLEKALNHSWLPGDVIAPDRTSITEEEHKIERESQFATCLPLVTHAANAHQDAGLSSLHVLNNSKSIQNTEKGYNILKKMGWAEGKGLGKYENGTCDLVQVVYNKGNLGLGALTAKQMKHLKRNTKRECILCRKSVGERDWMNHIKGKRHIKMEWNNRRIPTNDFYCQICNIKVKQQDWQQHIEASDHSGIQDNNNTLNTSSNNNWNNDVKKKPKNREKYSRKGHKNIDPEKNLEKDKMLEKHIPCEPYLIKNHDGRVLDFRCPLCCVKVSTGSWISHLEGSQHKRHVKSGLNSFYCDACNYTMPTRTLMDHVTSQSHQTADAKLTIPPEKSPHHHPPSHGTFRCDTCNLMVLKRYTTIHSTNPLHVDHHTTHLQFYQSQRRVAGAEKRNICCEYCNISMDMNDWEHHQVGRKHTSAVRAAMRQEMVGRRHLGQVKEQ